MNICTATAYIATSIAVVAGMLPSPHLLLLKVLHSADPAYFTLQFYECLFKSNVYPEFRVCVLDAASPTSNYGWSFIQALLQGPAPYEMQAIVATRRLCSG